MASEVRARRPVRGAFSLIELLIVVSIVAILVGLALPALARVRQAAVKTTCKSNLRQVGVAVEAYRADFKEQFPLARYMPDPFVSADPDPPLNQTLDAYIRKDAEPSRRVYHCPGDQGHVFALSGMSYTYASALGGQRVEEYFPVVNFGVDPADVWVSRDFDGGDFDTTTQGQITVPFFHDLRNLLFADMHVGNFE